MKLCAATMRKSTLQEELRIYEMARQAYAWNPKIDIPWNQAWGLKKEQERLAWSLTSQSVTAEEVGMTISAILLTEAEDAPSRLCLATAVSDEAKHTEVFARCALALGDSIQPPSETTENLKDVLLQLSPVSRFLIHTLLEGIARDEFSLFHAMFRGTIIDVIYTHVIRDESRHVVMGMEYLQSIVKRMSPQQVDELRGDVPVIFDLSLIDRPGAFDWLGQQICKPGEWVTKYLMRQNQKRINLIFSERR